MIKNHFKKEIVIDTVLKKGDEGPQVKKVQEWLNLWRYINPGWYHRITIDGDYGPQTQTAITLFQTELNLDVDGKTGPQTFGALTQPMKDAFTDPSGTYARQRILDCAEQHVRSIPRELNNRNEGPWVRAYMDGHEGSPWAWCMGFVQTIVDQSLSGISQSFKSIMPHTYSCDVLGEQGIRESRLLRNAELRTDYSEVQPGDIFLNVRTPHDWVHTGIITKIEGDWFHTVEGNTNDEGVREGFEVCKRMRNFMTHNIDVYRLPF